MLKKLFAALAMVSSASIASAGQAPAKAAAPTTSSKPYSPPKTPWGDPDLQGNYTSKYRTGHAVRASRRARRQEAGGHSAQGTRRIVKKRQQAALERDRSFPAIRPAKSPRRCSSVTSTRSPRQPRMVCDRSDRRQDSADGPRRGRAHRAASGRGQQLQQRRLRQLREPEPLRPLHHARLPQFDAAGDLWRLVSNRPGPGTSRFASR